MRRCKHWNTKTLERVNSVIIVRYPLGWSEGGLFIGWLGWGGGGSVNIVQTTPNHLKSHTEYTVTWLLQSFKSYKHFHPGPMTSHHVPHVILPSRDCLWHRWSPRCRWSLQHYYHRPIAFGVSPLCEWHQPATAFIFDQGSIVLWKTSSEMKAWLMIYIVEALGTRWGFAKVGRSIMLWRRCSIDGGEPRPRLVLDVTSRNARRRGEIHE
jgi:hypothetical protein